MKQVSFLHIADLHLDAPFSSLGDEEKAHLRRNEVEETFFKALQKVQEANIKLLLISGDLFEDKYIKGSTMIKLKNMFSEIYGTEIIIVPGNHDPISDSSYYKTIVWSSNVHVLNGSEQTLYIEKYNTCIYSLGIRNDVKIDYDRLLKENKADDRFNLLLLHGTVDMPFEEENYNSITSKELFKLGMDYIALGHMHCYKEYKAGNTIMVNPGSPEPLGFDEEGEHGFVLGLLNMSEDGVKQSEASFVPAAFRHYHNIEVDISDCITDTDVIEKIQLDFNKDDLYKITLTGFISRNYTPDQGFIYDKLKDNCFFLKLRNETSIRFEYELYLEDPGIKGEFVRRILDRREEETSQEMRDILSLAMQYGLQALENERVD